MPCHAFGFSCFGGTFDGICDQTIQEKSIWDANLESLRIFTEKDIWRDTSFSSFSAVAFVNGPGHFP